MSPRGFISSFVLLTIAAPSFAQEGKTFFDAPLVVADYHARFQQLGDINGDGYMDAFSGWWSDDYYQSIRLIAYINDGEGKLVKTWTTYAYVNPSSTSTWAFAAGDINADGLCDLAVGVGQYVQIYITGPGGGQPTASPYWITSAPYVTGLALLDTDADGIMEIAVLHGDLTILRYTVGSNALTPIDGLALGASGGELRNADVDGRGQLDLLAWDATRVWMIPMQGSTPQTPTTFLHGCSDPRGAAGDIDNDGDSDVVVFDMGQYRVFRRTSPTTFTQEPMAVGGPARFLYDLDGDGFLDGVCCGSGGPSDVHNDGASIFRIAMNDGTGHFAPALEMPGLGSVRLAGAADLDHDGDLDLVAGRCVYYSSEKFLDNLPRALPFSPRANALADFDCDKDADLEPGITTQRNLGNGSFASFTPVLPAPPPNRTWVGPGFPGDFDGDGDMDLIVSQKLNLAFEQMELLKNSGGGSFVDAGAAGAPGEFFTYGVNTTPRARDAIAADLDGDGDIDLVVTQNTSSKIYWNDGQGVFTAGPFWNFTLLVRRVADMNGDGWPDLVGFSHDVNNNWDITIVRGLGNGIFGSPYDVYFADTHSGNLDVFDIADADGDGDLDIVGCTDNHLYMFWNTGQPGPGLSFQFQLLLDKAVEGGGWGTPKGALFSDVDNDGLLDLICWPVGWYVGDAPNASYIFHRKSDNSGYESPIYQVMMPTMALDVDGDGDEDMLGTHVFRNRHFENTTGGMRKQTVDGIAGAGGVTPTLGASGPFRVGEQAEIVLTGTTGGVSGMWYQHYLGETPPPFSGAIHQGHAYLYYPPAHFTTSGTAGAVGEGRWSHAFEVPGYVAGRTKVYYCTLHDTFTPTGFARSNTLYVTYGP